MSFQNKLLVSVCAFILASLGPSRPLGASPINIDSLKAVTKTGTNEQRIAAYLTLLEWDDLPDTERKFYSRQLLVAGQRTPEYKPGWPFLVNAKTAYYFEIKDSVTYFVDRAIPIFLATNDIVGLFESYILGERHANLTGDTASASNFRKASNELWAKKLVVKPDSIYYGELCINKGNKAFIDLKYEEAFKWYEAAAVAFGRASKWNRQFDAKLLMARSCLPMAKHEMALEILNELVEKAQGMPRNKLANIYFFMAQVYNVFDDDERVFDLLNRAASLYQQTGNNLSLAQTYVLIGNSYSQKGNETEASAHYKKAIVMMKDAPYSNSRAVPMANLGSIYMRLGKLSLAKPYLDTAVVILKKHGLDGTLSQVYLLLADYSMLEKDAGRASRYYDSAYLIINKSKSGLMLSNYYANYSNHLKKTGDYKNALYYTEMLMNLNDSLNKIELKKQFEEFIVKHDTERVRLENSLLESKLEESRLEMLRQKAQERLAWLIVMFSAVLLLLLLLLSWVFIRNANYKRSLNAEKLLLLNKEKLLVEKEREALAIKLQLRNKLLSSTNKQLLQYAMFTQKLIGWIKELKPYVNKEGMSRIQNNLAEAAKYSGEQSWSVFESNFELIYPGFIEKLRQLWPDLTTTESRLICFIVMRLNNDEISLITSQTINSLRSARFRIRQKFEVQTNKELIDLIARTTGYQVDDLTLPKEQEDLPSDAENEE